VIAGRQANWAMRRVRTNKNCLANTDLILRG